MNDIEEKAKCAGELAKIDPFSFNDISRFDANTLKQLKKIKKRNWLFIVYPDSAPSDWIEILKSTGIRFAISPLHDKDEKNGKLLKPHYHVIICFDGPTSFFTASSYREITKGPYPKVCESLHGAFEYLIHKNNPDKVQYSPSDIKTFNGFELEATKKGILQIKKELVRFIMEHQIKEYLVFDLYVQYFFEDEYYDVATSNTYYFNSLCKSYRYSAEEAEKHYKKILSELEEQEQQLNKEEKNNVG